MRAKRAVLVIGLVGVVLAAGLAVWFGGHPLSSDDASPATPAQADAGAASETPLAQSAVDRFATSPLCEDAPATAAAVPEGHVLLSSITQVGGCLTTRFESVPAPAKAKRLAELRALPETVTASIDGPIGTLDVTTEDHVAEQWALPRLRASEAWERTRGAGVTVGVIDGGFDVTHPDLAPNIASAYEPRQAPTKPDNHGTNVSGIAVAVENTYGVTGLAPQAKLVTAPYFTGDLSNRVTVAISIRRLVDRGAKVINLSFFTGFRYAEARDDQASMEAGLRYAVSKDVVVVIANGNCWAGGGPVKCPKGQATVYWPASFVEYRDEPWTNAIVNVAAVGRDNKPAPFSNRVPEPKIAAPGVDIVSTFVGGYGAMSGTSQAAPHVTATLALVRSANPALTATEAVTKLISTAEQLPDTQREGVGAGLVNPVAAIEAAAGPATTTTTAATTTTAPRPILTDAQVRNSVVPAGVCGSSNTGWPQPKPIQLKNGKGEMRDGSGDVVAAVYDSKVIGRADFDGDGQVDVAFAVTCIGGPIDLCCAGRSSHADFVYAVSAGADGQPRILGDVIRGGESRPGNEYGPASRDIKSAVVKGSQIVTTEYFYYPEQYTSAQVGRDPFSDVVVTRRLVNKRWTMGA